MKTISNSLLTLSLIASTVLAAPKPDDLHLTRLTLHEWGTFTVLQNETGSPIPGVNINEESLPDFVHLLSPGLSPDNRRFEPLFHQELPQRSKGITRFNPAVTMRMETPIIYFHLPNEDPQPRQLDLEISFRHGWISEWYPDATNSTPESIGYRQQQPITSATTGRIAWNQLTVGETGGTPPATSEHVWLAPRNVKSDPVTTASGQTERYLFYRGVANLEAPLRVIRSENGSHLNIIPNPSLDGDPGPMPFPHLWLADIRADGTAAWRAIDGLQTSGTRVRTTPARFAGVDYTTENRQQLRASMKEATVADGLHPDEADALLNTWEVSYFKSPGLRLFFLLPQNWTDAVLPMRLSEPAHIDRVMIGRIELVTPEQRQLLARIGTVTSHSRDWFNTRFEAMTTDARNRARAGLVAGDDCLEDHGFQVPPGYRDYITLGRFRDALVVDEIRQNGNQGLRNFAQTYGIRHFPGW